MAIFLRLSFIALLAPLLLAFDASAQPLFGHLESLENAAVQAEVVVVGKIVDFDKDKRLATIAVDEMLKGKPVDRLSVQMMDRDSSILNWKTQASRLMVTTSKDRPIAKVLDLTSGELEIMTADFKVVRKAEDVIGIAKETIRRLPADKPIASFQLEVPYAALVGSKLGNGYTNVTLSVPVDDRLEKRAIDSIKSKEYPKRIEGAKALGHFKSEQNIAHLKRLLNEPESSLVFRAEDHDGIEVRFFNIRESAYNSLEAWGVKVEKPPLRTETLKNDIERVSIAKMTAEVLHRLQTFKNLRAVSSYAAVTDEELKLLATLKQIERLQLGWYGNTKVTDAGLKELGALTNLTLLEFPCSNLTDEGLKALTPLTKLTALDLSNANITGSGLKHLAGIKNLTSLRLQNAKVNNAALKELASFKKLATLSLNGTAVTNAGLKELAPLQNLATLDLTGIRVNDAGLRELAPLKNLNSLDFWANLVTDESLLILREINLLHALVLATGKDGIRPKSADEVIKLELRDTKTTDAGLKELAFLKNLETLSLPATVTDTGLKELAKLENLTTLYLADSQVTDGGLKELQQVKKLNSLFLSLTESRLRVLRENGMLHVFRGAERKDGTRPKSDAEIQTLYLNHGKVMNEELKELSSLKSLTILSLHGSKVTDAGLAHLKNLPMLHTLDLRGTEVTDEGLKHLSGLSELRELTLANSKVTDAGVFALRRALPKCQVTTK